MSNYIPCPNCFGAGKVGDPIIGVWRPCQTWCKYCMFGKDKGDRFECDESSLEKWLDEEVKE